MVLRVKRILYEIDIPGEERHPTSRTSVRPGPSLLTASTSPEPLTGWHYSPFELNRSAADEDPDASALLRLPRIRFSALRRQDPPYRRPADPQPPRDLGLIHLLRRQATNLRRLTRRGRGTTMRPPLSTRAGDARLHLLAPGLPLELREHHQHLGQRPTRRRRQVQRLAQRHEPHAQVRSVPATSAPGPLSE